MTCAITMFSRTDSYSNSATGEARFVIHKSFNGTNSTMNSSDIVTNNILVDISMTKHQCRSLSVDDLFTIKAQAMIIASGMHQCRCGQMFDNEEQNTHYKTNRGFICAQMPGVTHRTFTRDRIVTAMYPNYNIIVRTEPTDHAIRIRFGKSVENGATIGAQERAKHFIGHFDAFVRFVTKRSAKN